MARVGAFEEVEVVSRALGRGVVLVVTVDADVALRRQEDDWVASGRENRRRAGGGRQASSQKHDK